MDNTQVLDYIAQGDALAAEEKFRDALEYYNKAEALDPLNESVYISKGVCYANLEDFTEAKKQFEKSLKINRNSGTALFQLGNIFAMLGDGEKSLESYNQAVLSGFKDAQLFFNIGLINEQQNKFDAAVRNYKKAVHTDPSRSDIYIRMTLVLLKANRITEAVDALDETIRTSPDLIDAYHLKFNILLNERNLTEATKLLDSTDNVFPEEPTFIFDRIALLVAEGKNDEAMTKLNAIDEDSLDDTESKRKLHMQKAQITAYKGDVAETIAELEKAKTIFEVNGGFDFENTLLLTSCYTKTEDYEMVLKYSRAILAVPDDNSAKDTARYYEPYALKMLGLMEEALPLYKEAIEAYRNDSLAHPGFLDPYIMRSLCLKDIGEYDKAVELMDYVLKLKPDSEQAIAVMGSIKAEMKRGV